MNDANGKPMPPDDSWITASFIENRRGFPAEELAKYAGKHVGWGWDGMSIPAPSPGTYVEYPTTFPGTTQYEK